MAATLNTSSLLDGYVLAAVKPVQEGLNRLLEIVTGSYFSPGRITWNPDSSITVFSANVLTSFGLSSFDLQNDGVILAVDWLPGSHTFQFENNLNEFELLSIRAQEGEDGSTVSLKSDHTHGGYTTSFFVSRSSTTVKNAEQDSPVDRVRQVSYIHYKPGTRVFSLVNAGVEADTYTLPSGAFSVDRVLLGGGRPDDRIFGMALLRKAGSDFSAAEITELEDNFSYLFSTSRTYYRQFKVS